MIVLLDSGPLRMLCHPHPKAGSESAEAQQWLRDMSVGGHRLFVPAITDYETRREFVRAGLTASIVSLNRLCALGYIPVTEEAWHRAAELWAGARNAGIPTSERHALDGDVILAAQALTLRPDEWVPGESRVVVATTNVAHISRFTPAFRW